MVLRNLLFPAGLRPPITGAWPSKGQPLPPQALRPPVVQRLTLSVPTRSAHCGGGVRKALFLHFAMARWGGLPVCENDRTPHLTQPPQEPLAKRKGRVRSGRQFSAVPGLTEPVRQVHFAMPISPHPVPMGFLGRSPKQRFGSFAAAGKGTRSAERNIPVPKGHKSSS